MCGQVVCEQVVCGQVVWLERDGGGEAEAGGGRQKCTTKNKNPTQRCGEKHSVSRLSYLFAHLDR